MTKIAILLIISMQCMQANGKKQPVNPFKDSISYLSHKYEKSPLYKNQGLRQSVKRYLCLTFAIGLACLNTAKPLNTLAWFVAHQATVIFVGYQVLFM